MTSTPPAWKWRDGCDVPVTDYNVVPGSYPADVSATTTNDETCRSYTLADLLLSIHSHKLPDSDALRERNGSGTEPGMSSFTTRKLEPEDSTPESAWAYMASQVGETGCESTAKLTHAHSNAAPSHRVGTCYLDPDTGETVMPGDFFGEKELRWRSDKSDNLDDGEPICKVTAPETTSPADSCAEHRHRSNFYGGLAGVTDPPRCPVCLHEMENDEGILCDHCGEPTGPGSFAVVNGPGGVFVYHLPCYDEVYHPDDGQESEAPSDEAREREARCQANLAALMAEGYRDVEETDTFSVPFQAQEWFFEALIETEINRLHEIIDDHHDEILEMARKRHREGFVAYGSKGYSWDPKTRLRNVLEELSDGGTYLTMGPIE